MILVFDTETTGMVRWHEPPTHPAQPRLVQLGIGLYHPDGTEISAISLIVDSKCAIDPEAAAVHGIDNELCRQAGIEPALAMSLLESMAARATIRVAHNVNFDSKIVDIELSSIGTSALHFRALPSFCTMQASTPICRILKQNPRHSADYKWPKLTEAHQFFFNEPFAGAHDALSDVRACARIYFHLQQQGRGPRQQTVPIDDDIPF